MNRKGTNMAQEQTGEGFISLSPHSTEHAYECEKVQESGVAGY